MKATQRDRILEYVGEYGSITALEAMQELGIMRLASRIAEIKKMGYEVQTESETAKNRYGEPIRYARYKIGGMKCK